MKLVSAFRILLSLYSVPVESVVDNRSLIFDLSPSQPSTPTPPAAEPSSEPSRAPTPDGGPTGEPGEESRFRMDYMAIGHVRTDPIISQTCLSGHVHSFYGPPLLYPEVSYDDLVNSDPARSSGNVKENLSLYWHPAIYRVETDGSRTLLESQFTSVYYNYETGSARAFPNGFRMIGGFNPVEAGTTFACVNESPCTRPVCNPINSYFPRTACEELEVEMNYPNCWDGVNNDSEDHMSHVAYSVGGLGLENPCPMSHPVRLPRVEFIWRIFNYPGGPHEFSDGTGVYHADYISGWNETFLQEILDNCAIGEADVCQAVQYNFRQGLRYRGDAVPEMDYITELTNRRPPLAQTECITTETITGIQTYPEGCNSLISASGCPPGTPLPPNPTMAPWTRRLEDDEDEEEFMFNI